MYNTQTYKTTTYCGRSRDGALGVHLDNHLSLNEHITKTLSSCYGALAILRKIKHIAPLVIKKQLAVSHIFQIRLL